MSDDIIMGMLRPSPLIRFSVYTSIQTGILREVGREIVTIHGNGVNGAEVSADALNAVYGRFWLWVLGAYEVTRTMDQAGGCFAEPVRNRIGAFKRRIGKLRMPFAKQEYAGPRRPILDEASYYIGDRGMTFVLGGEGVVASDLIKEFDE